MTKMHRQTVALPDDLHHAIQAEKTKAGGKCSISEAMRRLILRGLAVPEIGVENQAGREEAG